MALTIARLIGKPLAREDFEKALCAGNDNAPPACNEVQPEAEDEDQPKRGLNP